MEREPKIHHLKIYPEYYQAVFMGHKSFEIRSILDRDFQVGDYVILKEYDKDSQTYTGRELVRNISYILTDECPGIEKGYAILSIQ